MTSLAGFAQTRNGGYSITPVPFTSVKVADSFWGQRLKASREVTIPLAFSKCKETGRYDNFVKAAHPNKEYKVGGYSFDDTDVYKTIEGASYSMQTFPDKKLEQYIDSVLTLVAAAQEPDGYLYTARTMNPEHPHEWAGTKRWEKEEVLSHELYDLGHMIEGAVAHYQATGKRTFLDIAIKYADCADRAIGNNPGQVVVVPGHQIAEMALCKLYIITGQKKYLDLAKFFLDKRGYTTIKDAYSQSDKPVLEQGEAVGHAVRAGYMYSGMADVAALTGDTGYIHAIAAMIFNSVAFKTVVSNGLVLDKNGNKMSKRLGNAVDPFETIDKYGSDPLRWYMITNASPWDNIKFDIDGVEEVRRKFFGTLYNTYSFFALYANVDEFNYSEPDVDWNERPEIDRWILSLLNSLVKDVDGFYNAYEPTRAGRVISDFVNDNLSNWYVRLNRRRFWGGGMTIDKLSAYQTLYTCLETVAKLMAPIAPFYADKLFEDLITVTGREKVESVHLSDFPTWNETYINKDLEERMKIAQDISSMILALRRKVNIKVRQPLQTIMVPIVDAQQEEHIEAVKNLILSEVNVKELKFVNSTAGILVKKIKPDFKKLGPRYGKIMILSRNTIESSI